MKETIVKINEKEIFSRKAGMSYLQIAMLIISSFAFSYLVYESSNVLGEESAPVKSNSSAKNSLIEFIINAITKPMIARVSASALNCCPKTKLNDSCLDFEASSCNSQCSGQCVLSQCRDFANCKLGCCYDNLQGTCDVNTPKVSCDVKGGLWKNSADCNINSVPECRLGCCVLGSNVEFVTSKRCEILAGQRNLETDFRAGITTEGECISLGFQDSRGACMFQDGSCKALTNNECRSLAGKNVFPGVLCTASALNSTCKPTNNTICVEGKDEVYFEDSCGNAANIYDSSKKNDDSYWERVVGKIDACGNESTNGNTGSKTCGNCYYAGGSKCKDYKDAKMDKPNVGEKICADLSCRRAPNLVDALGKVLESKDRRNGESWCVYDSQIGVDDKNSMSRDTVGSRHYRYSCMEGEVKVEPCGDFRNEICTEQSQFDVNGTSVTFSTASCRINTWQSCMEANSKAGGINEQNGTCGTADCFVKKIKIDKKFSFDICAPINKEGFDLSSEGAMKTAEQICGMASQKCTVVYKKKTFGGCEIVENGNCLEPGIFTKQMNELCVSLGDCGGYVNILGEYSDLGYSVKKVGKLSQAIINEYKKNVKPVAGQKVDGARSLEVAGQFGFSAATAAKISQGTSGASGIGMALGTVIGGLGFAVTQGLEIGLGFGFGGVMIGVGVGMIVGSLMAKLMGVTDPGIAIAMTFLGAVAGGLVGYMVLTAWNPVLFGVIIVIIIIMIILGILGGGKCKPVTVEFKCMPWQAPTGGTNCEKCNSGGELKTCSKYKCQSLGAACEFINEGSDKELCITKVNDHKAPVISPNYNILTTGFSYVNVTSSGFSVKQQNGLCIEAFTSLTFGINTDKPSQCKIDLQHRATFDTMENYFGDSNLFLYNHTMGFAMPSVELIMHCANDTNLTEAIVMNQIKNTNIYARCQDVFGNINPSEYAMNFCIRPGPDRTAPYISNAIPLTGTNLAFNTTSKDVTIYTNEPASCRWSKQDKSYDTMENNFVCDDACNPSLMGWKCNAILNNLSLGENNLYFRCKDQPWLEGTANSSKRNANTQSYPYNLKVTETPLTITRIIPNGTIVFGANLAPVDLQVDTAGGIDNGKAWCSYKSGDNWIIFISDFAVAFEDLTSSHTQQGLNLPGGDYILPIKCTDGGDEVYGNATFKLEQDTTTPAIVRIYNSGGSLYLFTNENSECAYSNAHPNCNFIFTNGTQMSGGFSQEHSAEWDTSRTYYVKCRDVWENEPSSCLIRIRAYNDAVTSF